MKNKKRTISIVVIFIGLIMILIGVLYMNYSDGVVGEKILINTPYIKGNVEEGTEINNDMIGYKKIEEDEYDELAKDIYVYSVDISGKCASRDLKDGDYFYINDLTVCEVDNN